MIKLIKIINNNKIILVNNVGKLIKIQISKNHIHNLIQIIIKLLIIYKISYL